MGEIYSKTAMKTAMKIHFIGIGGIGMSALAKIALRAGHSVSGSDIKESQLTKKLSESGARVFIGHNQDNLSDDTDAVVYSSAVTFDNVEITKAKNKNIPIWERARMLKSLMDKKTTITISGSHGKTTTTSLVSHIFIDAGLDPTIAVGGMLANVDDNALLGSGEYFIAEADESDGSFLYYEPMYSIITNIDYEHLEYYANMESIKKSFMEFMNRTRKNGCVFYCGDDSVLCSVVKQYNKRAISFGFDPKSDVYARDIKISNFNSDFSCVYKNKDLGRFNLGIVGRHNISNSLAAIAVAIEAGIDRDKISLALASFMGARRRFQVKFNSDNILVVDDYAHHPTEIKATLSTCKNISHKRVIAVFQPHRYTRTKYLFEKFKSCFSDTDLLFMTDIYAAGESPLEGPDARNLSEAIREETSKRVEFLAREDITDTLLDIVSAGDLVIFLGAGDITKVCDDFINRLSSASLIKRE